MFGSSPGDEEYEFVSPITGGVYLSGLVPEFPANVTAVVCLCLPCEMKKARAAGYPDPLACGSLAEYLWRPIPDDFRIVPPLEWLDATAAVIADWRRWDRTVLVHCAAGISRSPTVVAAYLMKKYQWSWREALQQVKIGRPIIDPNGGFLDLLQRYESFLAQNVARAA